jgi:hypothetical protein
MNTEEIQKLTRRHDENAKQIKNIERALLRFTPENKNIEHFSCALVAQQGCSPPDAIVSIDIRLARGFFETALEDAKRKQVDIEAKIRELACE